MRKHLTRSSYITYYFGRLYTSFTLSLYPSHPLPLIKKTINWKKLWRRFVQQVFHKFKSKDGIRLAHKLIDY